MKTGIFILIISCLLLFIITGSIKTTSNIIAFDNCSDTVKIDSIKEESTTISMMIKQQTIELDSLIVKKQEQLKK